jgi:phenylalanyl-tRNA synthetase alpha chain
MHPILSREALRRSLSVRDLTDPAQGPHSLQLVLERIVGALTRRWGAGARTYRLSPVVSVADNYDRLHYPAGGAARDARYSRYVDGDHLLRTQTSAMIPPALRSLAAAPPDDLLLVCPGLVYRRDCIDRLHTGEPHQVDLWRVRRGRLGPAELEEMVDVVVRAALPGTEYRTIPAVHPYTTDGLEIEVRDEGEWVEVGECGLALPAVLAEAGLPPERYGGLAMGLGLDRILMLAKGIPDIRMLRSGDPRIQAQMLDLEPFRAVSNQPPVRRDISIAVAEEVTPEEIGDRIRAALGDRASSLEEVRVLAETPRASLPPQAIARIGVEPGQKNVLLRVVVRDLERTLTAHEANELRDTLYEAVHEGSASQWAARLGGG